MSLLCRATRLQAILNAHRLQKAVATNLAQTAAFHNRRMIGKREVVGHGSNGSYVYWDGCENPYPAIRFREENDEIKKLLEKGKDDWKKLTLEEKKTLYRYNFCLTLAEIEAPTGEWKIHLTVVFSMIGLALFYFGIARKYFYGPLPASMSPEGKQATRDLEIKYKTNPIFGLASKFDYEKGDWK